MELGKAHIALAVLACLAALATGQLPVDEHEGEINLPGIILPPLEISSNDDPKPCCLPKQWQGNVTGQSGFAPGGRGEEDGDDNRRGGRKRRGFEERTTTVYVDEDKKSVAGRVACCNDTCGFVVVFGSNDTASLYLFKFGAQKCWSHKSNRAKFHSQCIPENATYGGSAKVGPAASGLDVQLWNFFGRPHRNGSDHGGIFVSGRALVTPSNCIPVIFQNHGFIRPGPRPHQPSNNLKFQSNQAENNEDYPEEADRPGSRPRPGHRGGGFMGSSFFTNVEPKVSDPTVFTPPSYCNATSIKGNTLQIGVDMDYPDILDRFVTFN